MGRRSVREARLSIAGGLAALVVALVATGLGGSTGTAVAGGMEPSSSPIEHVVVVYQENHTFDNVLGLWCVQNARCDGATTGQLDDGTTIDLGQAADLVPEIAHTNRAQARAINGGAMNGFDQLSGCTADDGYACYTQFDPSQIPNLVALASAFAVPTRPSPR